MRHWHSDVASFQRDQLRFFLDKACTHPGPIVRLNLGFQRIWQVTDPDWVRTCLKGEDDTVDKGRFIRKLEPIVGSSTLTLNGDENARRRNAMHKAFAKGAAKSLVAEVSATLTHASVELLRLGEFEALDFSAPLALRLFCIALFGKDVLSRGDETLVVNAVRSVERDIAKELFRVLPESPWSARARHSRNATARKMMTYVVNNVRGRASDSSVLSALASLGLNDRELADELITLLIAGHHTTGPAAAWIMYHLANYPEVAARLRSEANALALDGIEFTSKSLESAHTAQSFVREVLRLYPSAHWFSRDARKEIKIGDQIIRKGEALIFCPWQLHRDPRYWSAPQNFDIDRSFSNKAFMPFGVGARACIGMSIAMLNLQLIALHFASAFTLSLTNPAQNADPTGLVVLTPPTIRLRAVPSEMNSILQAAE